MSDAAADDTPVELDTLTSKDPERTCIVTRVSGPKEGLIRFVIGPEGGVVPDIRARLPGRGAWVSADAETVKLAIRRKSFGRSFKAEVSIAVDLVEQVGFLLEADALQALSLANKAGLVTCGTSKVEEAIAKTALAGLIHAREAAEDGLRKLDAALRRRLGEAAASLSRVQIFESGQLDLALGRTHVIHASLAAGVASKGFISRSRRLERFRGPRPPSSVG
ncbi:RNA-binding protein [Lichenihabitans sp. Uapishka_5]|uniref:RNA-binding protein n=1 Tax=Lichenihabitans sp. Uapishka_5 TaxID=3037302 RepID=UPI0029E8132F|nr:RNA-binding protein [Lichenihabitans sp. Uapishka_5]MDX7953903.1 RNA-binding protein [Lichenihabitans sp. Uapishka_5]